MIRDPAHYLKPLKTTRVPERLLFLDCAAQTMTERGTFVARWQCGALGTTHYTSRKGERKDTIRTFDDAGKLWQAADTFCTKNRRTTLFAYDLAYQLRVSAALIHLPRLGWTLDRIVLDDRAAWALFRRDTASLMLCDLKSWTPVDFAKLSADVVVGGPLPPDILAGPRFAHLRSERHVYIIREATMQILEWIKSEGLGSFKPTGPGQSYSAYRRRFLKHKLLVHDDLERLRTERSAMWTGRCEAWRHGTLRNGPFVEYDMQAAYCRIVSECEVPTIAIGGFAGSTCAQLERAMQRYAVLAEVTITTDVPCVPARLGSRTVWPVGTFKTVLWDPEIKLAMTYAKEFRCEQAYRYARAPAVAEFGRWVLAGMDDDTHAHGRVPQRVLKHWSRCLVGRLGLKFRAWEEFGDQDPPDLGLVTWIDTDDGTFTDMLIAGDKRMILADMTESTESLPQIPGWTMSECRRRLWEAMASVGLEHVVYVDTDSVVITPHGDRYGVLHPNNHESGIWTQKGAYKRMTIHGPRNLELESTRRVAGLPLTAKQVAPLEFSGQVMRSLKETMRGGDLSCVASIPRKFVLDAPDMRRQHLPGGQTAPFEVQLPQRTEVYD